MILLSAATLIGPTAATAEPTFLLGGGFTFGGGQSPQFALSGKVLSDDQADDTVLGLGLNYYPGSGQIGADVGIGYLFEDSAVTFGYDFLTNVPVVTFGWSDTEDSSAPPVDD